MVSEGSSCICLSSLSPKRNCFETSFRRAFGTQSRFAGLFALAGSCAPSQAGRFLFAHFLCRELFFANFLALSDKSYFSDFEL